MSQNNMPLSIRICWKKELLTEILKLSNWVFVGGYVVAGGYASIFGYMRHFKEICVDSWIFASLCENMRPIPPSHCPKQNKKSGRNGRQLNMYYLFLRKLPSSSTSACISFGLNEFFFMVRS